MKREELIGILNRDLADEHAAVLRYLVHGYLEGEDTPVGANLLSRAREEMWHMHWLGMIIADLGGEPEMKPAEYPFDPTNRATIIQSYILYEEKLIPHYYAEADRVDDPHIKRVFQREAWESAVHAKKFRRLLGKLSPDSARGIPGGEREVPEDFIERIQGEVSSKYLEMLQHIRASWALQNCGNLGWKLMDQAMEKMKQLAHFAEPAAENGVEPRFSPFTVERDRDAKSLLQKGLADLSSARRRHSDLRRDAELQRHAGEVINLDLTMDQEEYQEAEIRDWLEEVKSKK